MTVEELIIYGKKYIHSDHAKMLLAELLHMNTIELLTHLNDKVDDQISETYQKQITAIQNNVPIQYVIGNVNFYGNIIDITPDVLIPRFETEELIEKTVSYINQYFQKKIDIVDIGTGSGCIAIALKQKVNCTMDAVDISLKALEVAKKNIEKHQLEIDLYHGNLLEPLKKKYDVIISNPPYISEKEEIMEIVKDNEPNLALYAPENGLYCYRKILEDSQNHLKEKGMIAFEIGETQGEEIKNMACLCFPNSRVTVEKDLQNRDRFVFIFHNLEANS